jgi:hypothetical protein
LTATNPTGKLSLTTLKYVREVPKACLTFHYKEWKWTPHDSRVLQSDLSSLLKQSKIVNTAGRTLTNGRLHCTHICQMVHAIVATPEFWGSKSWDVTVQRILTLVCQAAIVRRSGDILRSRRHDVTKCLRFQDIELRLHGGENIQDIRLKIECIVIILIIFFSKHQVISQRYLGVRVHFPVLNDVIDSRISARRASLFRHHYIYQAL